MKLNGSKRNCPSCGAPVTTEICPYCHVATGLDTKNADMEYPVIECKEANITFFKCAFPIIFGIFFAFPAVVFPLFTIGSTLIVNEMGDANVGMNIILMFLPFLIVPLIFGVIGIISIIIGIKPLIRKSKVKKYGKDIEATVYGYMNDNIYYNGNPAQIVKLLVNTNEGKRFILYQLGDTKKPFKINSKIQLKVYQDIFLIEDKKKYYFE